MFYPSLEFSDDLDVCWLLPAGWFVFVATNTPKTVVLDLIELYSSNHRASHRVKNLFIGGL